MKRFLTLTLAAVLVVGAGSVAYANVCAFDPAPAATLLFPFVAYNYDMGFDGYNTFMAITNVSADAQIAHVTVWTDYSQAILDFNILLTGYDIATFNIRDILQGGMLPQTINDDWAGGVFDTGPWSNNNELVAPTGDPPLPDPTATDTLNCDSSYDAYPGVFGDPDGDIGADILGFFEDWLTISQQGVNYYYDCDGGDDYQLPGSWWTDRDLSMDTWMYITVDVVYWCNKSFPDSTGYFDAIDTTNPQAGGEALNDNVLIGDVQYANNADRLSEVDNAVHIEASTAIGGFVTLGDNDEPITFYGRYANNDPTGPFIDNREPLPSAWALRYQMADLGVGRLTTYIRAYKTQAPWLDVDEFVGNTTEDLIQGSFPPSYLTSVNCIPYTLYIWDEDEDVLAAGEGDPFSRPGTLPEVSENLLPLETQEVEADQFQNIFDAGWYLFIWPGSNGAPTAPYQTWMGVKYVLEGQYSGVRSGAVMANYNCFDDQVLPDLGINYNYMP